MMVAALAAGNAAGRTIALDLRPTAGRVDAGEAGCRRARLGAGATSVGPIAVGDRLVLKMFDAEIALSLVRRMSSPLGGETFLGEVAGGGGAKTAVIASTSDGLTMDIQDVRAGRVYSVVADAGGVWVKEIEPKGGTCACCNAPVKPARPASFERAKRAVRRDEQKTGPVHVDVLVAYDRGAAAWVAGNGGVTNFAVMAVQKMNAALASTGLDGLFDFRLVEAIAVDMDGGRNVEDPLDDLCAGRGGWAEVKARRDQVGADVVTLLIDTGSAYGTTGIGYSLESEEAFDWFGQYAYSVCSVRAVAQSHTMTHEIGHNMGAGHSDIQASNAGPQLYDYSSGYYFKVGERTCHTIMAYDSDGVTDVVYDEIPFFSSPDHRCEGELVGDARHDNTRTLRNSYRAVAGFRPEGGSESAERYAPSGITASDGTSTAAVSVEWHAVAGASFYTLYRGEEASSLTAIGTGITGLSFNDTTAVAGKAYLYAVSATVGGVERAASSMDVGYRRLMSPQITSVTGTIHSAVIAWTPVQGALYYAVLRTTSPTAVRERIGWVSAANDRSYADYSYTPGVTYYYYVVAVGGVEANDGLGWRFSRLSDESAGVPFLLDVEVSAAILMPEIMLDATNCCLTMVVKDAERVMHITNAATWRIVSGTAATLTPEGRLEPAPGTGGSVTIEAVAEFWGKPYRATRTLQVFDRAAVTGLSVTGTRLLDLYDETSAQYEAWLVFADGARCQVPAEWSVAGSNIRAMQISPSGKLSFLADTYTVEHVATAHVAAVSCGFSGSVDTVLYGPGYVYVTDVELNQYTVWPGATIAFMPKKVRWWRHGTYEAETADLTGVRFGWQVCGSGDERRTGDGLTFTVPVQTKSTNDVCQVAILSRPDRDRYYDWWYASLDLPFTAAPAPGPTPTPDPDPTPTPDPDPDPTPTPTPDPDSDPEPESTTETVYRLYEEISGRPPSLAASLYEGFFCDASGALKGTMQAKVAKPKNGRATVTVTAVPYGGKKATHKGVLDLASGKVVGLDLTLGGDGMSGEYGGYAIDGARSLFASKDKGEQAVANGILAGWLGTVNVAWEGGVLSVTLAKKGKAKVTGTLSDGTKVSASTSFLVGKDWCCVPVAWSKKGAGVALTLWLKRGGADVAAVGLGAGAYAGKPRELASGASFGVTKEAFVSFWKGAGLAGTLLADQLPTGVKVSSAGGRWQLAKAGKVVYVKGTTEVDPGKAGENPSGLKLSFKAKDGSFKGSFKAYADIGGKLKATTVDVVGVLVGDVGRGRAIVKKVGSVTATVK